MPTYLAAPPPSQQRMALMDALEAAGIAYDRQPDGYYIYPQPGQEEAWAHIRQQFRLVVEEEPPSIFETQGGP